MKMNQKGIGAIGIILILVVLGLVGFAGWYIFKKNSGTESGKQSGPTKSYTDSSKTYSVKVPSAWVIKETEDCCEGSAPDYSKVSRPVDFIPNDATENNAVRVQADSGTSESKDEWSGDGLASQIRANWKENHHIPQDTKINGHDAQYVKVHFAGDAEEYVDHQYLVVDGNRSVFLVFREFHNHPMSNSNWNDAKHMDGFRTIVESVSFTKR